MASSTKVDLCRLTASTSAGQSAPNGTLTLNAHHDLPSTSTASIPNPSNTTITQATASVKSESIVSDDDRAPTLHRETDLNYDSDSPKKSPSVKTESDRTDGSDLHPEEYNNREWNIEKIQYYSGGTFNAATSRLTDSLSAHPFDPKKIKTGYAYYTRDKEEFRCFADENRTFYRIGDYVYLEMDSTSPYVVGKIDSFRMRKNNTRSVMQVKVTKLYRREELVAESVQLLESERLEAGIVEGNVDLKCRELFPSDTTCTTSVGCLKGLCTVLDLSIQDAHEEGIEEKDTFFFCTTYSSDTGKVAPFHPAIRTGINHQAEIPPFGVSSLSNDADRDQLLYQPGRITEENEKLVIENARKYRSNAAEKCSKMNEIERKTFLGDRVINDTCEMLHRCDYISTMTIKKCMEEDRMYLDNKTFMSQEDCKKFMKGLRNYGKNFHKIAKEYLPNFTRDELVNHYYSWKKSSDGFKPKNPTRSKPLFPPTKRNTRNGTSTPTPADPTLIDYDSLSEDEECELNRACHHCYGSESRDWHHSGNDRQLLCTDCRHHFKKYGAMRTVNGKPDRPPPSMCREQTPTSNEDSEDGGVRTRSTRAHRHRTPIDSAERAPSSRGVESEPERRSTPQRSVKVRKRSYNVSSSSVDDSHTPRKRDRDAKKAVVDKDKGKEKDKDTADLPPVLENEAKRDLELRETSSSRTSSYDGDTTVPKRKNGRAGIDEPPPEPNARDNHVPQEPRPDKNGTKNRDRDVDDDDFVYEIPPAEFKLDRDYCCLRRNAQCATPAEPSCARTQIQLYIDQETDWQRKRRERQKQKLRTKEAEALEERARLQQQQLEQLNSEHKEHRQQQFNHLQLQNQQQHQQPVGLGLPPQLQAQLPLSLVGTQSAALQGLVNMASGASAGCALSRSQQSATGPVTSSTCLSSLPGIGLNPQTSLSSVQSSMPVSSNMLSAGGIMQTGQGLVHVPRLSGPDILQQQFRTGTPLTGGPRPPNLNDLILAQSQLHSQQLQQQYQRQWAALTGQPPHQLNPNLITPAALNAMGIPAGLNPAVLAANPQLLQQVQHHALQQQQQQHGNRNSVFEQLREMEERKRREQKQQLEREQQQREREQREQRERQQQQAAQQQQEFVQQLLMAGMNPQQLMTNLHLMSAQAMQSLQASQAALTPNQQLELIMRAQQQAAQQQQHQQLNMNNLASLGAVNPQMAALLAQQAAQRQNASQPQQQQAQSTASVAQQPAHQTHSASLQQTAGQGPLAGLSAMAGLALGQQAHSSIQQQQQQSHSQHQTQDMNMLLFQQLLAAQQRMGGNPAAAAAVLQQQTQQGQK